MEAKMELSLLVLVTLFCNFCCISATVPALIWGQNNVKDVPVSPAGHTLSSGNFADITEKLSQDAQQNILLFLQNKLSLDDVTANANVYTAGSDGSSFRNLKRLMKQNPSTHIPKLVSPASAVRSLRNKYSGKTHEILAPYSLDDATLSEGGNLILVHLPEVPDDQQEIGNALKEIDNIIGSISSTMENHGKDYSAIYTAMESSKVDQRHMNLGRHLLAAAENTHTYYIDQCILFYAENMTLKMTATNQTANNTFPLPTADTTGSTCDELKLQFTVPGLSKLNMNLKFSPKPAGFWAMTNWTVEYQRGPNNNTVWFRNTQEMYAPINNSYHCSKPYLGVTELRLDVTEFQIQAFNVTKEEFGWADDCVGFFSIPIWMGIISCLLLLSILTFGLMLLANISTMDRFDDPKGKTITVNVGE